jgi:hypothetical protein
LKYYNTLVMLNYAIISHLKTSRIAFKKAENILQLVQSVNSKLLRSQLIENLPDKLIMQFKFSSSKLSK